MSAESAIEARLAVVDVMSAYAAGVDSRDWALVHSCFHSDAYIQGTRFSAALPEYFPRFQVELEKFERTVHFLGNQRVRLDADRAWLETYAVARHFWTDAEGVPQQLTIGVRYHDDFRRQGAMWAIAKRVVDLDWSDAGPAGPGLTWTPVGATR